MDIPTLSTFLSPILTVAEILEKLVTYIILGMNQQIKKEAQIHKNDQRLGSEVQL